MLEIMRAYIILYTKTQSSFLSSCIIIQLFSTDPADHLKIQLNYNFETQERSENEDDSNTDKVIGPSDSKEAYLACLEAFKV